MQTAATQAANNIRLVALLETQTARLNAANQFAATSEAAAALAELAANRDGNIGADPPPGAINHREVANDAAARVVAKKLIMHVRRLKLQPT